MAQEPVRQDTLFEEEQERQEESESSDPLDLLLEKVQVQNAAYHARNVVENQYLVSRIIFFKKSVLKNLIIQFNC